MNLGYACINMELAAKGITTNRGMIEDPASKREAHSDWMPEKNQYL